MLQGYIDDSGRENQGAPFVLAGYILPAERWGSFSDDWSAECAHAPSIRYFKFYDAVNAEGEFDLWQYDLRRHKVLKLIEVIRRHQLHGICSAFRWDQWNEFSRELVGPAKNQPYAPLFFLIIDTLLEYQRNLGLFPQKTQLDFDEQGKWGQFAIEWYGRMWEGVGPYRFQEEYRQILEGTPRMLDDKEYVPLQAADMLAGAIRLKLDDPLRDPGMLMPNFQWVYEELHADLWGGLKFGKETWDAIKVRLPRP